MRRPIHALTGVAALALVLGASAPSLLQAQDRPDEPHAQAPDEHHDAGARGDDQRDHSDHGNDDVARLQKAHPHAAARCHDGFFTTTRDRARACSKHGGIDVWLSH